ncbi:MAG: hypothetical protein Q8O52_23015 [Sulfuritalea sp.]|nr:hypothetical protein [Sulfuritalea sp.]
MAAQIAAELNTQDPLLFRTYKDFFNESGVGDDWIAREVPSEGSPEFHADLHDVGVRFVRGKKQNEFMHLPSEAHAVPTVAAIQEMRRETVQVPRSEIACATMFRNYQEFLNKRNAQLRDVIAQRVADEDVQSTVLSLLLDRIRRGVKTSISL